MAVGGHALARLVDLVRGFKQEGLELSLGERAIEIKERAVFRSLGMARALFLAALEKALQQRGVEHVGREGERARKPGFALAQREGGRAAKVVYPAHLRE